MVGKVNKTMEKICSLFDYGNLDDETKDKIKNIAEKLINEENVTKFYFKPDKDLHYCSVKTINTLKEKYPQIGVFMILDRGVIVLMRREIDLCDKMICPKILDHKRNRLSDFIRHIWMVHKSDYIITCYNTPEKNVLRATKYAKIMKKHIFYYDELAKTT